jgi:hypothetical protein
MLRYSEISEPTRPGEADWVDFPASPEPDPWAALLREASRLSPDVSGAGTQRAAGGNASNRSFCPQPCSSSG